jgi:hypothetical protein
LPPESRHLPRSSGDVAYRPEGDIRCGANSLSASDPEKAFSGSGAALLQLRDTGGDIIKECRNESNQVVVFLGNEARQD